MSTFPTKIKALLASKDRANLDLALTLIKSQKLEAHFYYLARFGEMLDYLRTFEHITIVDYYFSPPVLEDIQKIEEEFSKSLAKGVKNFYEQCGGMHLFWLDKRREEYERLKTIDYPDYGVDGYIDIKGIYQIYYENPLNSDGYGTELIDKELTAQEVEAYYHSFDYFSVFNDMMAYTGGDFTDNPLLIMGDDHQACYTDSRLIDIPSYLELVFYCCGSTWGGRSQFLKKYNGHKLPILTLDRAFFAQYPKPDFSKEEPEFFFPKSDFWN